MSHYPIPAYQLKNESDQLVLQTPELLIEKGEVLAVTGPSGSGKSLWLKSLFGWSSKNGTAVFSPKLGAYLMIQDPSQGLTPLLSIRNHFREVCSKEVMELTLPTILSRLGFPPEILERSIKYLSGGERQRIMMALLLVQQPKVLVCDEPAASLDPNTERKLWEQLLEEAKYRNFTLIFVTHQLSLIQKYANRVLLLESGKCTFFDSSWSFFEEPQSPYHRRLIQQFNQVQRQFKPSGSSKPNLSAPNSSEAGPAPDPNPPAAILELKNVCLTIADKPLIQNLSLVVRPGDWWWWYGRSGCGKTSLARTLVGLQKPAEGKLILEGTALPELLERRSVAERRRIQYIFQHGSSMFNPARNVATQLREVFKDELKLEGLLLALHVDHTNLNRGPASFSLGELARLNLIRVLACEPKVIIGDELLASLDLGTQMDMIRVLSEYSQRHAAAVILVTHDPMAQSLYAGKQLNLEAYNPNL